VASSIADNTRKHATRFLAIARSPAMTNKHQISVTGELWSYLRTRKKWWLAPIIVMLMLFGALLVFAQGSAIAPFIYTLF